MTAKEKLRRAIEDLSEAEAERALGLIVDRHPQSDSVLELLDNAPPDDEPTTPEEEEGVREAKAEVELGEVVSAEEIKRELG